MADEDHVEGAGVSPTPVVSDEEDAHDGQICANDNCTVPSVAEEAMYDGYDDQFTEAGHAATGCHKWESTADCSDAADSAEASPPDSTPPTVIPPHAVEWKTYIDRTNEVYCITGAFFVLVVVSLSLVWVNIAANPAVHAFVSYEGIYFDQVCDDDSCSTEFIAPDAPLEQTQTGFPNPCRQSGGVATGSIYYVHRTMSGDTRYAGDIGTLRDATGGKGAVFVSMCICSVSPYTGNREQFCTSPVSGVVDQAGGVPSFLLE